MARIPHSIQAMDGTPRKDWQDERGGRIDPLAQPKAPMDSDDRVDEAIAESFPASDPPSFTGGVEEHES